MSNVNEAAHFHSYLAPPSFPHRMPGARDRDRRSPRTNSHGLSFMGVRWGWCAGYIVYIYMYPVALLQL